MISGTYNSLSLFASVIDHYSSYAVIFQCKLTTKQIDCSGKYAPKVCAFLHGKPNCVVNGNHPWRNYWGGCVAHLLSLTVKNKCYPKEFLCILYRMFLQASTITFKGDAYNNMEKVWKQSEGRGAFSTKLHRHYRWWRKGEGRDRGRGSGKGREEK